jgi:hypothetical protein
VEGKDGRIESVAVLSIYFHCCYRCGATIGTVPVNYVPISPIPTLSTISRMPGNSYLGVFPSLEGCSHEIF